MTLDPKLRRKLLKIQKKERTHYEIYKKLSTSIKDENNRIILKDISEDEKNHYLFWKDLTKKDLKPQELKIAYYMFLANFLSLSFSLKLMERGEEMAVDTYGHFKELNPNVIKMIESKEHH